MALEYYNPDLHPTCADFRVASRLFLESFFGEHKPTGRIADVGCGLSIVRDFVDRNLVLIDSSAQMLAKNLGSVEKRLLNVEEQSFGDAEFDWVFAILADPFNSIAVWRNIRSALKDGGRCIFVVPSYRWALNFRAHSSDERKGFACFRKADNSFVYLRSTILSPADQVELIEFAGLRFVNAVHVLMGELPEIKSPKISDALSKDQPLLDVYQAEK
ncbi:SAM-dependent methyltransferase [Bradyrhizobium ottawaense]|uniref:class I SAM-dependent methyltransferase n=1 Tax=Bradyrhizobium ottawaense TaxID=931866 RepID=UPI00313C91E8